MDHGRHSLEIDLVHDAVARRNHVYILERELRPVDEMKAILVAAVLDRTVFRERILVKPAAFDSQRVIDDQLHRDHRIDLGRVSALLRDGVAQSGQVHESGLAENVMTYDASREPGEVEVASALDDLRQRILQKCRVATAHQVLRQHARRVRQLFPGARPD